jgi:hypothetical protein
MASGASAIGAVVQPTAGEHEDGEEAGGLGHEGEEGRDRRGGALVDIGRVEVHGHGGDLEEQMPMIERTRPAPGCRSGRARRWAKWAAISFGSEELVVPVAP